jgi:hypothetical protein
VPYCARNIETPQIALIFSDYQRIELCLAAALASLSFAESPWRVDKFDTHVESSDTPILTGQYDRAALR